MKTRILILTILLLTAISLTGFFVNRSLEKTTAAQEINRVRFQITAIEEKGGASGVEREILSETTIEGLPGTDFNINLQTERFRMQARFLSDLLAPDKLKMRANLNTRRLYGQSERGLPLYEEDAQNQTLELAFDQSIVLLPFGRNGGTETLQIEITPTLLTVSADAKREPLKIEFGKQLTSGEISVQATKIPHRFEVEAILLADGKEIARGVCDCLLEEAQKIALRPNDKADAEFFAKPLEVNFTVDGYTRSRPADSVAFKFDLLRAVSATQTENERLITKGAGAATLGNDLNYRIETANLPPGDKKYELRFNIRLGKNEIAE